MFLRVGHLPPRTFAPYEKWYLRTSVPLIINKGGHLPPDSKKVFDICPPQSKCITCTFAPLPITNTQSMNTNLALIGQAVSSETALPHFFVKKPKIFENVKSERAAANFQKSRTPRASTIISKNSQIEDIKNMFAGLQ